MTLPDRFIEHGDYRDQLAEAGLTAGHIAATALQVRLGLGLEGSWWQGLLCVISAGAWQACEGPASALGSAKSLLGTSQAQCLMHESLPVARHAALPGRVVATSAPMGVHVNPP